MVELAAESEQPVSLVGWSLGGVIAREVARRRPDLVRRMISYGTPVVGGPSYTAVAGRYTHEARGEATRVTARLDAQRPIRVPITVIGMGVDPDVWEVVADRLAR